MIKRLLNIIVLLILTSRSSVAEPFFIHKACWPGGTMFKPDPEYFAVAADTVKIKKLNLETEDKRKIKEIAKAKRQAKPEKLGGQPADTLNNKIKIKLRRQRRPEGLERPPEILRRNNN